MQKGTHIQTEGRRSRVCSSLLHCRHCLLSTHPLSLFASINLICLECALFSLFKKIKTFPSFSSNRKATSDVIRSLLWALEDTCRINQMLFPFTTYLTMADPGLCLYVAHCFGHAYACPFQNPGSESQLLRRLEVHSNDASPIPVIHTMALGPGRGMVLSSAQGAVYCSNPTAETPETEQSLSRPLWMGSTFTCFLLPHTRAHMQPVFAVGLPDPECTVQIREPGLLPFCLCWH